MISEPTREVLKLRNVIREHTPRFPKKLVLLHFVSANMVYLIVFANDGNPGARLTTNQQRRQDIYVEIR